MQYSVRKGESLRNDCCHSVLLETSHPLHALRAKDWHVGKFLIWLVSRLPADVRFPWAGTSPFASLSHLMSAKKTWALISSASFGPLPSLFGRVLRQ
jgi:hypothetical protein